MAGWCINHIHAPFKPVVLLPKILFIFHISSTMAPKLRLREAADSGVNRGATVRRRRGRGRGGRGSCGRGGRGGSMMTSPRVVAHEGVLDHDFIL